MTHSQIAACWIALALLLIFGAFFSAAETGLMAINRYRLRHKARMKKRSAILILRLLKRPDRLLGMILIGNTIANIFASSITTIVAVHLWGEEGAIAATAVLTFVILIFSEIAPKTVAALYPERIARWVAWPIFGLLKILYPVVWLMNAVSNSVLRLFQIHVTGHTAEPLSREELRTIVHETSGRLPQQYQNMLLGILDLNSVTVNDVMVPQHEIVGIDFDLEIHVIREHLAQTEHDWLPLYRTTIDKIIGMVNMRDVVRAVMTHQFVTKELLMQLAQEPYFIPEATPLNVQLLNFQHENKRLALVVDEYGEIQGLLTLADITEEIMGEFEQDAIENNKLVRLQKDGSYLVAGTITIRELNRITHWQLPTQGPRTLSGLVIEYLEAIPRVGVCVKINDHPMEIMQVRGNTVKTVKVFPSARGTDSEL